MTRVSSTWMIGMENLWLQIPVMTKGMIRKPRKRARQMEEETGRINC